MISALAQQHASAHDCAERQQQQQHQLLAIADFQVAVVTFPASVAEVVSICVSSVCVQHVAEHQPYNGGQTPDGMRDATRVFSRHRTISLVDAVMYDIWHVMSARGHMQNSRVLVRVHACRRVSDVCVCWHACDQTHTIDGLRFI